MRDVERGHERTEHAASTGGSRAPARKRKTEQLNKPISQVIFFQIVHLVILASAWPSHAADRAQTFSLDTSFGVVKGDGLLKELYPGYQTQDQHTGREFFTVEAREPKAIGPEAVVEVSAKEFPYAKGTLAVAVISAVDSQDSKLKEQGLANERHVTLFILSQTAGKWSKPSEVSLFRSEPDDFLWVDCPKGRCQIKFDFGDYRMSETNRAFGVRIPAKSSGSGSLEEWEELLLFERTPTNLKKVFHETLTTYESDQSPLDGSGHVEGDEQHFKSVLMVDKNKTKNRYDWILTTQTGGSNDSKNRKPKRRLFQWNGTKYIESKS